MSVAEPVETKPRAESRERVVRLPLGLLGFEHIKDFVLVTNPDDEPFLWLQVKSDPNLAFLVLSPFGIIPAYRPDIPADDIAFLQVEKPTDALLLCVVTVRGDRPPTINLKGPIVLNRHTLLGKQVIPTNAASLSVACPLPATTS
jgi:flagellar assembly factor FliW